MDLIEISSNLGRGVGKLVGGTRKVLSVPGNTLSMAMEKLRSVFPRSNVRNIVTEELIRLMGAEGLAGEKLEQRLQVMAETIVVLQKRIDELVAQGYVSETDVLDAMDSLETANSLSSDEKAVLVNVFRQNIAIQKPELVGTEID
jgi:FtsZ-binding cell division protein ZapB